MTEVYDSIGTAYNTTRRPDPRLWQVIWSALGECRSVLNVGAGTGAYEPAGRTVVAVEPSVLVVHWDQSVIDQFWLADYFPEAFAFDRRRGPSLHEVRAMLEPGAAVVPLPVPHHCQDGFGAAYWRRPRAYLDPAVRAGISMLAQTEHERGDGVERLRRDLTDGTWAARHHVLLTQDELDCGYRIVTGLIAGPDDRT